METKRPINAQVPASLHRASQAILDLSLDLICNCNTQGYFTQLNPAFHQTLGWTNEELLASPFFDFVHPADLKRTHDAMESLLRGEDLIDFENRHRCKDGSYRTIQWRCRAPDAAGNLYATGRDITHQTRQMKLMAELGHTAHIGGWELDYSTQIVTWTPQTFIIHDLPPNSPQPTLEQAINFYAPQSRPLIAAAVEKGMTDGSEWSLELQMITAKGRPIWVLAQGKVDLLEGVPQRAYGSFQDITERRLVAEALKESEERYRTIVEDQTEFIARWHPDGIFVFINDAYASYLGVPKEELTGVNFLNQLGDDAKAEILALIAQITPQSQVVSEERRKTLPDGRVVWQRWQNRGFFDEQGQLTLVQSVGRDITERKAAEQALRDSQQRLTMALRSSHQGVWDWHLPSGKLIFDERWCQMLGYELDEVTQHVSTWETMIHPDDVNHVMSVLKAHLEQESNYYETEHRVMTKSGQWKWILDQGQVVERDKSGQAIRMVGTHMDIDDRKRAAAAIEEWKDRYEAVLDASQQIMYDWDPTSGVVTMSGALYRVLGRTQEEMNQTPKWFDLVHPDDLPLFKEQAIRVAKTPEPFVLEYRMRHADGHYVELEDHGYFLNDPGSKQQRLIGFLSDMTDRKEAERQRLRTEAEFSHRQKVETIGNLAAGIAHDFSNLLTAITGHLALANRSLPEDHPSSRSLAMVEQATQQGLEMTRSITSFANKSPSHKEPLSLASIVTDSLRLFRHLLPSTIEVHFMPPDKGGPWILAARTQMQQVIMNLLLNARDAILGDDKTGRGQITLNIQFMPRDAARDRPHIRVDKPVIADADSSQSIELSDLRHHVAVLSMMDSGTGMDEAVLARLFEPFFTTKERQFGTGLGLPMVYGIIQEHGGWIHVVSKPGEGSRFDIVLPVCAPVQPQASHTDAIASRIPKHRPRIVGLLHPDDFVCEIMVTTLEEVGYKVIGARSPQELLNVIKEHGEGMGAIIINADMLPENDESPAVFELLRQLPDIPTIVTTVNTAQFMDEPEAQSIRLLPRPFQMSKLVALLDEATGIRPTGEK